MLGKIVKSAKGIEDTAQEMFESFKYCFSKDSEEKWIKMFAHKRLERIKEEQLEDWGNKLTKKFEDNVIERFTELVLLYVSECKKAHREQQRKKLDEEKEKTNKGIKRGK